jgi:hypothetical protein
LCIVATATDQVYAFDDQTYAVVWERNFTNPASGITQQSATDTGCGDVNPDVGITGTPVIDRAQDRMYVVVPTKESGTFHLRLHALALSSGADACHAGRSDRHGDALRRRHGDSTNPEYNFQRGALLEANNTIYVPLGSHCDYDSRHGARLGPRIQRDDVAGRRQRLTRNRPEHRRVRFLGAVWMSGFGPAADSQGNVYFVTGNGPVNGTTDFRMSVLQVPGSLSLSSGVELLQPVGAPVDSAVGRGPGCGRRLALPDVAGSFPHLADRRRKVRRRVIRMAARKAAKSTSSTAMRSAASRSGDTGALWHLDTGGGMWGGPAYFQDTNGNSYIVYGGGSPITTYLLNDSRPWR